jgi:hypothetical protein
VYSERREMLNPLSSSTTPSILRMINVTISLFGFAFAFLSFTVFNYFPLFHPESVHEKKQLERAFFVPSISPFMSHARKKVSRKRSVVLVSDLSRKSKKNQRKNNKFVF